MKSEFMIALTQIAAEKNLPKEVVLEAVESALTSAYKKESPDSAQNISVKINPATGQVKVHARKTVAGVVSDPNKEMSLAEAKKLKASAAVGDVLEIEFTPINAGRIAAQTAKQIVLQRLRDAEHDAIFKEYAGREGDIVSGVVQQIKPNYVVVDLGRSEAILPASEQIRGEHYRAGQRLKLYIMEVVRSNKGTEVIVSRAHRNLLRRLLELEVSELSKGVVEIMGIAREAGYRSKVAVVARQPGVDPIGCCVGPRAIRIQNVMRELEGEKIDVVQWSEEPSQFVVNALSPAQVLKVTVDEEKKIATVIVPDRQLSLAIGKEGQNARLAAKLTGWRIDIKSLSMVEKPPQVVPVPEVKEPAGQVVELAEKVLEEVQEKPAVAAVTTEQEDKAASSVEADTIEKVAEEAPLPQLIIEEKAEDEEEAAAAQEEEVASFEEYVPEDVLLTPTSAAQGGARIRFAEDIAELAGLRRGGKDRRALNKVGKADKKVIPQAGGKGKRSRPGSRHTGG